MQNPFSNQASSRTPVVHLTETGSTNAEAMRLAQSGEQGPLWVTATSQTGGRGRHGREWLSLEGNLFASLMVTLACEPTEIAVTSLLAGVALADATETVLRTSSAVVEPRLKWPNDLMLDNAKCAGILVETSSRSAGVFTCVLGFGVNLASAPQIPGRPTTSLAQHGLNALPEEVLEALDSSIRNAFAIQTGPDGFAKLRQIWLSHGPDLGTAMTVETDGAVLTGCFAGLDVDGALLLTTDSRTPTRITFGDVSA